MRQATTILFLVLAGPIGCTSSTSQAPPAGPPTVTVSLPLDQEVTDFEYFTGRTDAVQSVQVRARVSGYLTAVDFVDGQEVRAGDILFEIDPRPYEAALKQAEGQVAQYQAQLAYNEAEYRRELRLYNQRAAAPEEVQQALSQRNTSQAQLESAKANVIQQKLNLEWTKVSAPIGGLVSRRLITEGNLVVADNTILTTVVSQDPMYAYFDVDEQTVLVVRKLIREGKFTSIRDKRLFAALDPVSIIGLLASPAGAGPLSAYGSSYPGKQYVIIHVFLGLANEQGYPHEGYVNFVNNQLTTGTATLQVRGVFPNPRPVVGTRLLSPGMFVRIQAPVGPPHQALLVPQGAVGTDQNVNYLYVLDDQNKVVRHNVQLGAQHGEMQVIAQGLEPGQRVIVNGIQHVHPGMEVNPRLVPVQDFLQSEFKGYNGNG